MTQFGGQLFKMAVSGTDPVEYSFVLAGCANAPKVNGFLGKRLSLNFTGKITCINCQRATKKSFQQGHCFPCMQRLAACDMCILKPATCHHHHGTCREHDWGLAHCFVPHIVYLANSSGLKVGVTRETQIPTRWIDQGATQALPIMRVQSRYQAGLLEVEFAKLVADKTDWRKMLKGANADLDLAAKRDELIGELVAAVQNVAAKFPFGDIEILTAEKVVDIKYPVLEYPQKITSLDFDKTPEISGVLQGIKAQYLIFNAGVINLRKYTGYEIQISV